MMFLDEDSCCFFEITVDSVQDIQILLNESVICSVRFDEDKRIIGYEDMIRQTMG